MNLESEMSQLPYNSCAQDDENVKILAKTL